MYYDSWKDKENQIELNNVYVYNSELDSICGKFSKEYWRIFSKNSPIKLDKEKEKQLKSAITLLFFRLKYTINEMEIHPLYVSDIIEHLQENLQDILNLLETEFELYSDLHAEYITNSAWIIDDLRRLENYK